MTGEGHLFQRDESPGSRLKLAKNRVLLGTGALLRTFRPQRERAFLGHKAPFCGATSGRFNSTLAPRQADVLDTGDIGGDRLTCYMENLGWLSGSEPGPRRAAGPRKTLRRELGPVLRTLAPKKRAVTKR